MNLSYFPNFKKNYPFYPLFILRFILFSCLFWEIRLKLRQGLTLSKDRKRIKNSELVEYIVDLVFVGQVCPTDQPKLHKRTKMGNLKIVGWKMLKMVNLKMIERTFPPLNFWWEWIFNHCKIQHLWHFPPLYHEFVKNSRIRMNKRTE